MGQAGSAVPGLRGDGLRIAIVVSRFNEAICEPLLEGALAELASLGVLEVETYRVPGALEIPLTLQWLAQAGHYDALVALGCVIRGDTYHFEIVCNESARGITEVQLQTGVPVANGIVTTENDVQAQARLGKGAEAARVAVEMARVRTVIKGAGR